MKIALQIVFVSVAFGLAGCASTQYLEYRGAETVYGKGGAVKIVNGMDVWTDGDPDRPYRIIGLMNQTTRPAPGRMIDASDDLVALARKNGADAVIVGPTQRRFVGWDLLVPGAAIYHYDTKNFAVKYVDEKKQTQPRNL